MAKCNLTWEQLWYMTKVYPENVTPKEASAAYQLRVDQNAEQLKSSGSFLDFEVSEMVSNEKDATESYFSTVLARINENIS